jgi:hypothetical protein
MIQGVLFHFLGYSRKFCEACRGGNMITVVWAEIIIFFGTSVLLAERERERERDKEMKGRSGLPQ